MRGIPTAQCGPSSSLFRLANLFPLALVLAGAAVISGGCASVAASTDSRNSAKIAIVPESVRFPEVVMGQENSQTIRVTNNSSGPVRLEGLRISGEGFSVAAGLKATTLVPGQSAHFTVGFKPVTANSVAGELEISTENLGTISVPLEGSGEKAAPLLEAAPNALNFGALPVHSASSQAVTLKNAGNVAITIGSIGLPGAAFSVAGLSAGTTLSPGQTLQFRVTFQPSVAGAASSGVVISSSSLSSPVKLAVSGSGSSSGSSSASGSSGSSGGSSGSSSGTTSPGSTTTTATGAGSTSSAPTSSAPKYGPASSVQLSWDASGSSAVTGYHIYRGSVSGGPYSRINGASVTALNYDDATVQGGNRYYYVVCAVNGSGDESAYSNEAVADIPNQ